MTTPEGMFGVPRSVIPDDLYSMLVKAKTRDWQLPGVGNLSPRERRRIWVVSQLMDIRDMGQRYAEQFQPEIRSKATPPVGVEVVKLEWQKAALIGPNQRLIIRIAETPFGKYTVDKNDDGSFVVTLTGQVLHNLILNSPEDAEAAAQSDFDRRIRSALVPSSLLKEAEEALRTALVAMTLAKALPGVADEYDFEPAIAEVTAALARLGAAP